LRFLKKGKWEKKETEKGGIGESEKKQGETSKKQIFRDSGGK
jgi:hypothetical protein